MGRARACARGDLRHRRGDPRSPETPGRGFLGPLKRARRGDPPPADEATAASALAGSDRDPIDSAADEALDDWEELVSPLLAPVRAIVDRAPDLATLQRSLAAAIDRMDVSELTELLARAQFGARLAGDVDGRGEA